MKKSARAILASSIVMGGLTFGLTALPVSADQLSSSADVVLRTRQVKRELGTFAQLAKQLNPSVVNISVVSQSTGRAGVMIPEEFRRVIPKELLPQVQEPSRKSTGQGSGVIISSDGEILTNNHVVEGASEIKVALFDGREFDAEVVGTDSNTDLALIRLKDASELPVAALGDSDEMAVGDWVMAIGNPFGLEATVTVGVLSGKGRVIGAGPYDDYLQTDASINPGNSGGPLFNIAGEVIGINTAMVRGGQGIGFSIPINLAKEVSTELAAHGQVKRGFIGVGIQALTPALKAALSIPKDVEGALVASLVADGPAAKAGVEVSDVIIAVEGQKVTDDRALLREVAKVAPGTTANLKVLRSGKEKAIRLQVVERPNDLAQAEPTQRPRPESTSDKRIGVTVTESGEPNDVGVVVSRVAPNSPAARAGLRRGDKIRSVGNHRVKTVREFESAVKKAPSGDLALLVERGGRSSFLLLED